MPPSLDLQNDVVVSQGQPLLVGDVALRANDLDLVSPASERVLAAELGIEVAGYQGHPI